MAVVFPYVKQTWTDGVHSCDAARNNVHEDGIYNAHNAPAVRAYHNASQSVNTATITVLALNSERFDVAGGAAATQHDNVTNNSRLTCRYAGKYMIGGTIAWTANTTGYRQLLIRLNGATFIGSTLIGSVPSGTSLGIAYQEATTLYDLAVGDYVEMVVVQDSGSTLSVQSNANYSPEFWMVRVA